MIRTAVSTRRLPPFAQTPWLVASGGDDPARPHVEFLGGGFSRLDEADDGFVVKPEAGR